MAVMALVAEKLFDPVQQMRQRANEVLSLFPQTISAPYKDVRDLDALCVLVRNQTKDEISYSDREAWLPRWRDLFMRFDESPFVEQDLKKIIDPQAVIGWTAANVFRRFKLSAPEVRQLRAYYDVCMVCDSKAGSASAADDATNWQASTIRSRVVHAMGATDTRPVVDLLFAVLSEDRYLWSRIGAARSLIEIAALTANDDLRRMIIDTFIEMVHRADQRTLASKTLWEIGYSAFYRNAHGDWEQVVTPLMELVRDRQQLAPEQEWWSNLLTQFHDFSQTKARETVA